MNDPIWDDGRWTPLAPLSGDLSTDVCVVGLGGSGLMAVQELVAAGASVAAVDARGIGGGAAGRNAGFLLAGLADFFPGMIARGGELAAVELYRETLNEIERLRQQSPELVTIGGILRLAADEAELRACEQHGLELQRHGFPAEPYAGPEGRGLLLPSDGTFQPLAFVRAQAQQLISRGARLHEQTPVTALEPGRVVTPRGTIACGQVIVAVDGGLEKLLPELQPRVRTARLQMLATAPDRRVKFPRPIYWRDGFEYWQQLPNGVIALGGFRDAGGASEWTDDSTPSANVQEKLERFLREHLRSTSPVTHRWAASVSYTEDGLPVLEEVRKGVFATGAYSGTGNTVGRLGGRAAAHLALGRGSAWADSLTRARRHAEPSK